MMRWSLVALVALNGLLLAATLPLSQAADVVFTSTSAGVQVADLQEQLEKGLRARRPEDIHFIEHVVEMVEDGELPLELVKSTFHWVRTQRRDKKNLVPYFKAALKLRAEKLGITI